MRQIICDRCGAGIPDAQISVGFVSVDLKDIRTDDLQGSNPFDRWDLCDQCMAEIMEFVRNRPTQKAVDTVKAKPKNPGKRDWDKGKAQALRDAGWSMAKIAKELGVNESTVYKNTKPPKPKKARPNEWAESEPDLCPQTKYMMGEIKEEPDE